MNKRFFNPNSARAKRGKNWEQTLFDQLLASGYDVVKVREKLQAKYPDASEGKISAIERREGDLIVSFPSGRNVHLECIVCPPEGTGNFPEHKRNTFVSKPRKEKWYAFIISSDGLSGEQVFIPAAVWNKYSGKLPATTWNGKPFRTYDASIIKSIRASKKSLNSFL